MSPRNLHFTLKTLEPSHRERLHTLLLALSQGNPPHPGQGICYQIEKEFCGELLHGREGEYVGSIILRWFLDTAEKGWPHFSGLRLYPIPIPVTGDEAPRPHYDAFGVDAEVTPRFFYWRSHVADRLWQGEQGKMRQSLARFADVVLCRDYGIVSPDYSEDCPQDE